MEKKNQKIRHKIRSLGLTHWEVADACGITAGTLTVWLRKEVTGERRERVLSAIESLTTKRRD